jgi:hypothetical protein
MFNENAGFGKRSLGSGFEDPEKLSLLVTLRTAQMRSRCRDPLRPPGREKPGYRSFARLSTPNRLRRPLANDPVVRRPCLPHGGRPFPQATDVFLKSRRVLDVKNRELAARLRLRETFKRIARLDRVVYRPDCNRGRQAVLHESAQTDEVRGDRLSRAAGHCRMLHGIGVHRQLLELCVAMISDSSGTDPLIDCPASR